MLDAFRYYTRWHDHANRHRYRAPAEPWHQIRVDPRRVDRFNVVSLRWGLGRVRGGDWDLADNCRSVAETDVYQGLRQRFVEGLDWTETAYLDWARREIDENGTFRGCDSVSEVLEGQCAAVDDLHERIARDGYRGNYGTTYDDPEEVEFIHELDPIVLIGRDGEVIWSEGFHRLVLARILDVSSIPVHVLRRHAEWQNRRDAVDTGERNIRGEELDHPDLRDIVQ